MQRTSSAVIHVAACKRLRNALRSSSCQTSSACTSNASSIWKTCRGELAEHCSMHQSEVLAKHGHVQGMVDMQP